MSIARPSSRRKNRLSFLKILASLSGVILQVFQPLQQIGRQFQQLLLSGQSGGRQHRRSRP
jgi:hypothetical protein